MGIKERKEREKNEQRELILNAASEIIKKEGIENLSIRKIAATIEYSPAIIYHYFHNKEEIINILMKNGYEKILVVLSSEKDNIHKPEEKLENLLRKYIDMALQMPEEYKTVLLNHSPQVLEHTSILFQGVSSERESLRILCKCLKDIYVNENMDASMLELTAQIIWTATFGLILRLIIEKNIGVEQRERLIDQHINLIVHRILIKIPPNILFSLGEHKIY
ncbi:TetR/AcrR family transcriptional regulator [Desnuesiella massiliensis]|uniref:TetR/AcrR family transcriptional regulator n=1 Tax=Desnuesiella massiliensis TaxID=1650662 RepID=UPI0006E3C6D4|nr:TetR/AcrR family transcriptional regulator [Desnuesiella massiliensis]